jgi:hypothetical protein
VGPVTAFDLDAEENEAVDYRLMAEGFVTKFWDSNLLGEKLQWLIHHGYHVVEVDTGPCETTVSMLDALAEALHFPGYFGRNLDALNDCLRHVAAGCHGAPSSTGLVLVLHHYETFVARDPRAAGIVLDIIADRSRGALLFGHRMMCLVQTDDPGLDLPPVGTTDISWSEEEDWHLSARVKALQGVHRGLTY